VGNNNRRKLEPEEFRGFILPDEYAPLIFVNGADGKAAQMFTLAHELGHLWLGRGGVFNLIALQPVEDEVEKFCNRIAAEFLIPAAELRASWTEAAQTEEPFQTLAQRFKVSPVVGARRALDLGLISPSDFSEFYRHYQEDERRQAASRPSGGDFYATQEARLGRRFGEAVIRAAREGRLLYREAYQLTGLFGQTFDRFAKGLGVAGGG
jgi:Zn-dependent peptidase ImmA (M78 family)